MNSPTKYFFEPRQPHRHRFAYIGVPHDAATSLGNPGARYGPRALREAFRSVAHGVPVHGHGACVST